MEKDIMLDMVMNTTTGGIRFGVYTRKAFIGVRRF